MVKVGQTKKAVWKFPGGLSDEGESIGEHFITLQCKLRYFSVSSPFLC